MVHGGCWSRSFMYEDHNPEMMMPEPQECLEPVAGSTRVHCILVYTHTLLELRHQSVRPRRSLHSVVMEISVTFTCARTSCAL